MMAQTGVAFSYKQWLKKRQITTKLFYFIGLILGIEYSFTFATLLVYLKDFLQVKNNLNIFYSCISGIYILSMIISSVFVGKIFDRTRRTRLIFSFILALVTIGNVLYTIPISPYLLLFGRLLSGLGDCLRAIIVAEVARSFAPDEVVSQISAVSCTYVVGFTLGPCINSAFVRADFWFLGVHVEYSNGASLVTCFLYMIAFFLSLFFVSDLSREFDLKEALKSFSAEELEEASLDSEQKLITNERFESDHEESTPMIENKSSFKTGNEMETMFVLRKFFTNLDTILILVMSFTTMFCVVVYDLWVPLACIELLNWTNLDINLIYLTNGTISLLFLLVGIFKPPKTDKMIYLGYAAFPSIMIIFGAFFFFKFDTWHIIWLDAFLWLVTCLCLSIIITAEELFLITTLAKMVPSQAQSISEGIRLASTRLGSALGLFTATFTFQHLNYFCPLVFFICILLILLLIIRRRQFYEPVPIF
uniref:Major facilitator superfamily (MFS) profile domain-containing protein n=1 Tax=Clytia hemisphaerica TaxID=252671 RepID=A0A7M6DLX6_9CNID